MSRILLAGELGTNYGHLLPLAAVAERLRAAGHEILFAVRDLGSAVEVLGARGFTFAQAPLFHRKLRTSAQPVNHAEMLALVGYADEAAARGLVSGWIALLRMFRAEAIAANHAPGALLAGHILGLPLAQIGTGFEIPPLVAPLPSIRPWEPIPEERLRKPEHQMLRRINRLLRPFGAREFDMLADWFRTEARILTTLPEVDPFGPRLDESYVGGIYEHESGDAPAWPEGEGSRIFAYLRNEVPGARGILEALSRAAARTICVIPGVPAAAIRKFSSDRLRIVAQPVQLRSALAHADLGVIYGGHGVVCAALAAGVPLLVAPHNV